MVRSLRISESGLTLEVGCGDGYLLPLLPGRFRIGSDQNVRDLVRATRRGVSAVVAASGDRLPFRTGFSLVCAFDVVEHVEDDVAFLRECASVLDKGGRLLLTTPAGRELWSHLDVYAGHRRRYGRAELRAVAEKAGLKVERLFPLFRLLWPFAFHNAWRKRGRRVEDPAAEYSVGRIANVLLRRALAVEWKLFRECPHGRGTSWCVVARRG